MREVVTSNLERELGEDKLRMVILAFRFLFLADPKERHFSLKFCNSDEGRGLEVWVMLDEYPPQKGGLTATFLLPGDY